MFLTWRAQWWVVLICLLPLSYLCYKIASNQLNSADPAREVVLFLGLWSLRLLLCCLTVRPLSQLLSAPNLFPMRRTLGLFALFYAMLHALAWSFLLIGGSFAGMLEDIAESPYVLVGMLALVLLIPLGPSSTRRAQRALGVYWRRLHRLVYVATGLACVHFIWLSKEWLTPLIYLTVLITLFLWRIIITIKMNRR